MDIEKWANTLFPYIERQCSKAFRRLQHDLISRNVLNSGMAVSGRISVTYATINEQLMANLKEISTSTYLKEKEWDLVEQKCLSYVERVSETLRNMKQEYVPMTIEQMQKLIDDSEEKKDLLESLSLFIELEKKKAVDRKIALRWKITGEVTRMLISALAGALIGGYLSTYVFKLKSQ